MTKTDAALDEWVKDIAPSPGLRKWYGHDPEKWSAFQKRYRAELKANGKELARLRAICAKSAVTFVYAAKDKEKNSASVLKAYLESLK